MLILGKINGEKIVDANQGPHLIRNPELVNLKGSNGSEPAALNGYIEISSIILNNN